MVKKTSNVLGVLVLWRVIELSDYWAKNES